MHRLSAADGDAKNFYGWGDFTPARRVARIALGAPLWVALPLLVGHPPLIAIATLAVLVHLGSVVALMVRHYTSVQVSDAALMHRSRGRTHLVHWQSIRSLRVREQALEIDTEHGSVTIGSGFHRAADLVREIAQRLPNHLAVDHQAVGELETLFEEHEVTKRRGGALWCAGLAACLFVAYGFAFGTGQPLAHVGAKVLVTFVGLMALAWIA